MENTYFQDNLPVAQRQEVEFELNVLNQTAPQINDLENQLLTAKLNYQEALAENANKLKTLSIRLGKCVQRSRPYYELRETQVERLSQIQEATERYTSANSCLSAAREELSKLETELGGCKDTVALERMNEAISKVNIAKQEVTESYRVHEQLLGIYNGSEQTLRRMERRYKSDIIKARPYFETKQQFDRNMQEAKLHVDLCAEKVALCKSIYADALSRLERISASVHDTRRRQTIEINPSPSPPSSVRGEGVGAESVESIVELACPESDVFTSKTRLNEMSIFHNNCPVYRLPSPPICPGPFASLPVNSPSRLPLASDLLQHMCKTAARMDAGVHESTISTPPSARGQSIAADSPVLHTPRAIMSPISRFTLDSTLPTEMDRKAAIFSNPQLESGFSKISSSVSIGDMSHDANFPSTLAPFAIMPVKRAHSLSNVFNCGFGRS